MDSPALSVVVPNYNHARHLPACIEALLKQSVPAHEILLIDDGSTDDSLEVMRAYARRDPRIQVHAQGTNRGVIATLNRGIELAHGTHLFFPGADDVVLPGIFEKSLNQLSRHPHAALSCTTSRWRDERTGVTWLMGAGMGSEAGFRSPDQLVELERAGRLMIVSHSAILRTEVVREFGGFHPELRWHCDWFLAYASAFRHGLVYVPEVLSEVNLQPDSYYGSGQRGREHAEVMRSLLSLLSKDRHADIAERIRVSGALALHSTPMLRAMLSTPRYRRFLTARLVRKVLWRRVQVEARRRLPAGMARWCVRVFVNRGAPDGNGRQAATGS